VPFATQEAEFSSQQAAFFYGLAVGFSIAGRLLFGWLADRWPVTLLMAAAGILMAVGPAVLELLIVRLGLREAGLLWLYSIPFGTGIGGNAVFTPVLVGRCFGELHFSKIMGLVMSGFALGIITGIPLAGWIFDRTGSYEGAFVFCIFGLLGSALIAALIRPERYHGEFAAEA
jgi:MFS family permease